MVAVLAVACQVWRLSFGWRQADCSAGMPGNILSAIIQEYAHE